MNATVREAEPTDESAGVGASGSGKVTLEVLVIIDHLALGGAEMMLGQFAAAAPLAGIRLRVACLEQREGNPAAAPLRAAGVEPVDLEVSGRPGLRHLIAVRRHIDAVRPDLVHTHLGTSDLVGGIAARSLGIPMVSTIHAVVERAGGLLGAKHAAFNLSRRLCAARVIAVSDSAREAYLKQSWHMGERVVRIYNGVAVDPQPGSGADVRRELGIGRDECLIGMVSALRPEKGHDLAIETIARLRGRFPRIRLLIAGQGPSAEQLAHAAAPLGDAVLFTGPRADIMRVFDALDVCLHPSRIDALPTTLIESLAASVPVLATAVGGIPEIIDDGRTGVLLAAPTGPDALATALASLLDDRLRRHALGAAGRAEYELRFTAEPWIRRTRELYDEVLAERRRLPIRPVST